MKIDDANRGAVLGWLDDRNHFHTWFSGVITGSLVILLVFGAKPGFATPSQTFLSVAQILLLFAILCNFVSVWSIPSWKFKVRTLITTDNRRMRLELGLNGWLAMICFVSGLTLAFIGNMPA
jgi:hypothetical protein